MKTILRWLGLLLLFLVLVGAGLALTNRDKLTRLNAVLTLFDEDKITRNFSQMGEIFFSTEMPRGSEPVAELPQGPELTLPEGADAWITDRALTALVVLKDGQLVHESYYQDTTPEDRRISWSVAKSFLSVLTGILMDEGAIASLDDPVTKYAPELTGSAYDGATIRNVLQMSSGVEFDEDYLKFSSDINKMGRVLALGGSMDAFAAGQDGQIATPGESWKYVSIDTHVIGMVLRGATGRMIPDLMAEKLIAPLGLEMAPIYLTDGYGVAFVLGGLNMPTRDYARLGQMVLQEGAWQGQQIVSAQWLAESTAASAPTAPGGEQYGYQWWLPHDAREGEVFARGVYGQYIYIDRTRGVVIASNATDRAFREEGAHASNIAMFRQIAEATDG